MTQWLRRACVAVTLAQLVPAAACAAALEISTVMVTFEKAGAIETLALRNAGATPIAAQIRAFEWQQTKTDDVLARTTGLIVSPPFCTIAPGQQQTVNVLAAAPQSDTEQAYRLYIDELPSVDAATTSQVRIALRYSVPAFVPPPGARAAVPALRWQLNCDHQRWSLHIANDGPVHAQIASLDVIDPQTGKTGQLNGGLFGYVLAHAEREWPLEMQVKASDPVRFAARINGMRVERTAEVIRGDCR
jgi:fimbrial chaperone protein